MKIAPRGVSEQGARGCAKRARLRGAVLLGLGLTVLGCGYTPQLDYLGDAQTVYVRPFENSTDPSRREHEVDLTRSVVRLLRARTGLGIASYEKADIVLEGDLGDYQTPGVVENRQDVTIQSEVRMTLGLRVRERRSGRLLYEGERTEVASFASSRLESEVTARAEAVEKLSRWAVSQLEQRW